MCLLRLGRQGTGTYTHKDTDIHRHTHAGTDTHRHTHADRHMEMHACMHKHTHTPHQVSVCWGGRGRVGEREGAGGCQIENGREECVSMIRAGGARAVVPLCRPHRHHPAGQMGRAGLTRSGYQCCRCTPSCFSTVSRTTGSTDCWQAVRGGRGTSAAHGAACATGCMKVAWGAAAAVAWGGGSHCPWAPLPMQSVERCMCGLQRGTAVLTPLALILGAGIESKLRWVAARHCNVLRGAGCAQHTPPLGKKQNIGMRWRRRRCCTPRPTPSLPACLSRYPYPLLPF